MKKIYFMVLAIGLSLSSLMTYAQTGNQQRIEKIFGSDGEIYFKFSVSAKTEADQISRIISIDNFTGTEVYAYANRKEFSKFLELNIPFTILPHPGTVDEKTLMRPEGSEKGDRTVWNFYPTYQEYLDFMNGFATQYPSICKVETIGTTTQGRQLLALKISDNVNSEDAEPQFFYTSSIHGDEITGYILTLHLIDYLLSNYGVDQAITNLIDSTEIFINPLANPDGTYHGGNNSVNGAQRYNANNVDLNRNYPDPVAGPHPDGEDWQPETVAFMAFADSNHFNMSGNFHGGAEVLNYPWDTWSKLTADDDWWQYICREYVDTVHLYSGPGYFYDFDNGITNGYAWYTITGGRQDYMNYFQYCREVTMEISDIKLLPTSMLLTYWGYNYRSMINHIQEADFGVHGIITDSVTGAPLNAKLTIMGHDKDNSFVFSKLPSGYYSRYLYTGTYNLSFSCAGYFTKQVKDVSVVNGHRVNIDVQMVPLNIGNQEITSQRASMLWPNPASGSAEVVMPVTFTSSSRIMLYNSMGQCVITREEPSGTTRSRLDISGLSKGLYFLKVSGKEGIFEDRLIVN
jgi:hypothetical protein